MSLFKFNPNSPLFDRKLKPGMNLIVHLNRNKWRPSNKERLTARISEETKFLDSISQVSVLTRSKLDDTPATYASGVSAHMCPSLMKIPTNLKDFFPHMVALDIHGCGLKSISRKDLKGLKQLKEICIRDMMIKELPGDLFADLINLEVIDVSDNLITSIGKETFTNLEKVKFIDLRKNPGINVVYAAAEYDTPPLHRVYKLDYFISFIDRVFFGSHEVFEDLNKVLRCNDFKDFKIKIGQKEFKVHKILLVARCPTLAEMIKNNPNVDELILEDIAEDVFEIILDFIYHATLPAVVANLEELFVAAGKLKLEKLKNHVAKWIIPIVSKTNVVKLLQLAAVYNSNELKAKCIEEIKKIVGDSIHTFDDDFFANFELLKVIVEEKLKADERIQKAVHEFKKIKI